MGLARMPVPKLVGKVSDTSSFCFVVGVDGCLSCEEHDDNAELRMKRDFG